MKRLLFLWLISTIGLSVNAQEQVEKALSELRDNGWRFVSKSEITVRMGMPISFSLNVTANREYLFTIVNNLDYGDNEFEMEVVDYNEEYDDIDQGGGAHTAPAILQHQFNSSGEVFVHLKLIPEDYVSFPSTSYTFLIFDDSDN